MVNNDTPSKDEIDFIKEEIHKEIENLKNNKEVGHVVNKKYFDYLESSIESDIKNKNPFRSLSIINVIKNLCNNAYKNTADLIQSASQSIKSFILGILSNIKNLLFTLFTPKEWSLSGETGIEFYEIFTGKISMEVKFGK